MASLSTNRNSVSENQATIKYSVSTYTGDSVSYSWDFGSSSQNGSVTINIYPNFEGYDDFSAKCTIKVGTKTETTTGEGENQKTEISWSYEYYYESDSIRVYAHPGSFSMGASSSSSSSNNIIANVLTTEKINKWINHVQKAYHWYNQSGTNYNTTPLQIPSNKIVSHTWFNACMDAMRAVGHSDASAVKVNSGDLITADLINQMDFSGKK